MALKTAIIASYSNNKAHNLNNDLGSYHAEHS